MRTILYYLIQFLSFMFALSVHEASHAWVADRFGDSTARRLGRVTLNPIAHIDLFGTVIFPIILAITGMPVFGWAKPVPVNPYNLRNPKRDSMWVSAAGPVSNLLVAAIGALILHMIPMDNPSLHIVGILVSFLIVLNIFLAAFNLIPIPPLDGSGIVEGLLKGPALEAYLKLRPYSMFILLGLVWFVGLGKIIMPVLNFLLQVLGIVREINYYFAILVG
jgi:Zn-dependent protease